LGKVGGLLLSVHPRILPFLAPSSRVLIILSSDMYTIKERILPSIFVSYFNAVHTSGYAPNNIGVFVTDAYLMGDDEFNLTIEQDGSANTLAKLENLSKGTLIVSDYSVEGRMDTLVFPDQGFKLFVNNLIGLSGWDYSGSRWISGFAGFSNC